ncbi:MAG: hypothetical protein H7Y19_07485, partial [Luteimonas sp.]|nr:hypothetical protein [Luteimonas sp.]
MKMKLLDYTLICMLAGIAPATAQESSSLPAATGKPGASQDAAAKVDCTGATCVSTEGVLMRVRTRGERQPIAPAAAANSQDLQPDRRVTVETEAPGKAVAIGKWSVQLPNGGVIWATEDPSLGQAELNASAPSFVAFDGQRITQPVQFYVYSNYPDFIDRAEITLYRATDTDLVSPIATLPLQVGAVSEVEWDGKLPQGVALRAGDELQYIVRAYGKGGSAFDETYPRRLQLVRPEEAERGTQLLRGEVENKFGTAFSTEQAEQQSLIDGAFGQNSLRQQNIGIYGSRIRIQGRNIPDGYALTIDGKSQPVDLQRKLVAEYLVPIGRHTFDIAMTGPDQRTIKHTLDVDVSGRYMFAVAIADLTASGNDVSGSVEPLAADDRYDDSFLIEGR